LPNNVSNLYPIDSALISGDKNPTLFFWAQADVINFSAIQVLQLLVLANKTITSSPLWKPPIILSNSSNPLLIKYFSILAFLSNNKSYLFLASLIISTP
jgi:hypothetical protein